MPRECSLYSGLVRRRENTPLQGQNNRREMTGFDVEHVVLLGLDRCECKNLFSHTLILFNMHTCTHSRTRMYVTSLSLSLSFSLTHPSPPHTHTHTHTHSLSLTREACGSGQRLNQFPSSAREG